MIFLGWKSEHLVLIYYLDSVVSIAAVLLLCYALDEVRPSGAPPGSVHPRVTVDHALSDLAKVTFMVAFAAAFMGFPLLLRWHSILPALTDRALLIGVVIQLLFAAEYYFITRNDVWNRPEREITPIVRKRVIVVAARWFAVFVCGLIVPYTVVMVVAYLGASVYLELYPPNPGAD